MNEALAVGFNPVPAAERVARWHAIIRSRFITLGIVVVALVALWFLKRSWLVDFWYLAAMVAATSVLWILGAFVLLWIANKDLAALGEGTAMVIDRQGVTVRDEQVPWAEVVALTTRSGGPWRSPLLVVEKRDGQRLTLPLDYLDRSGGELDNTARAYSSGRFGVDLSGTGV